MSKRWFGFVFVGLLAFAGGCAEGLTVDPSGSVSGDGGFGQGGASSGGGRGGGTSGKSTSASGKVASTGSAGCAAQETACPDGTCILTSARCDGVDDCPGGEDEAACGSTTSSATSTSSATTGATTSASSTSATTTSAAATTGATTSSSSTGGGGCGVDFTCTDGACVSSSWACDGTTDCEAGNDEDDCAWTCDPAYLGDGDCDCGCGAPDPDCIDSSWLACDYCTDLGSCALLSCFEVDSDQNWACGP